MTAVVVGQEAFEGTTLSDAVNGGAGLDLDKRRSTT